MAGLGQQSASSSSTDHWSSHAVELVPCDYCGACVPFADYMDHIAIHKIKLYSCAQCSVSFTSNDESTEQVPLCSACLLTSQSEMELSATSTPETAAMQMVEMVRTAGQGMLPSSPSMATDVCNFDLAVGFVRELSFYCRLGLPEIELVYHWTCERNLSSIVDNNLRVPGDTNADGSRIQTVNGAKYGRGIYAATDLSYGRPYGRGAPGALLCLALPGKVFSRPRENR